MLKLNALTDIQAIDAEIFDISLSGNYAIIASMGAENPDSLVWYVAESDGSDGWNWVYFASESIEDAQDIFSILDEADYEAAFDLFENAELMLQCA